MSQQNGYIGRAPGDSSVIIASQTFEPTGIQTDFTFAAGYDPGYIDVYFNGARLVYANDYTATNGSTVGLTTYANNGDVLELVAYKAFNLGNITESAANFTVGNQLTVVGTTTATSAYYTGVVTATSFAGDGSSLTGVASTDNIITGTAVTITNTTNSTSTTTGALQVSGGVGVALSMTVGGSLSVGGTITYEDVTNVDSVGIVTARGGIEIGASGVGGTISPGGNVKFTGITTVGAGLSFADDIKAKFGAGGDLSIYHDGSNSYIKDSGTGDLKIQGASDVVIEDTSGSNSAVFNTDGSVELYYRGASAGKKLETTTSGVIVTGVTTSTTSVIGSGVTINSTGIEVTSGIITAGTCFKAGGGSFGPGIGATILGSGNAVFAGIVTATNFVGGGSGLTGLNIPASFTELDAMLFN